MSHPNVGHRFAHPSLFGLIHPMSGYLLIQNNPGVIADGGPGADHIVGGFGPDALHGGEGDYADSLYGLNGDELLLGGDGNDWLWGDGHTDSTTSYLYAPVAVHGNDDGKYPNLLGKDAQNDEIYGKAA
jgi:Ca2+-binding RTX toxin-like protein